MCAQTKKYIVNEVVLPQKLNENKNVAFHFLVCAQTKKYIVNEVVLPQRLNDNKNVAFHFLVYC